MDRLGARGLDTQIARSMAAPSRGRLGAKEASETLACLEINASAIWAFKDLLAAGAPTELCTRGSRVIDHTGNRQLNAAIHRIAVTQKRCHDGTRAYLERRIKPRRPLSHVRGAAEAMLPTKGSEPRSQPLGRRSS